jgi:hypothetical protein
MRSVRRASDSVQTPFSETTTVAVFPAGVLRPVSTRGRIVASFCNGGHFYDSPIVIALKMTF